MIDIIGILHGGGNWVALLNYTSLQCTKLIK